MKTKTISTADIILTDVFELWFKGTHIENFDNLEDVRTAMIRDVMKRNDFYAEPKTTQMHLFKNYKVVKTMRVQIDDDVSLDDLDDDDLSRFLEF